MITTALILLGTAIVSFLTFPFPESEGFPQGFTDGVALISSHLDTLSPLLPYGTLLLIIQIVLGIQIIVLIWRGARWAMSHIPIIGGNG